MPVMTVIINRGPDKNPRYMKTMECSIDYFLMQDLDALFIATNAPGPSVFNRVERRMALFSKEIAGVILDHKHFGAHVNSRGETIDKNLRTWT